MRSEKWAGEEVFLQSREGAVGFEQRAYRAWFQPWQCRLLLGGQGRAGVGVQSLGSWCCGFVRCGGRTLRR